MDFKDTPNPTLADQLFDLGVEMNRVAMAGAIQPSDLEARIAIELMYADALTHGLTELPIWGELPILMRERYRQLARRTVRLLDPDERIDAARAAVEQVEIWINGPHDGHDVTATEIAREALARYESILSAEAGR